MRGILQATLRQAMLPIALVGLLLAMANGCRPRPDYAALGLVEVTGAVSIGGDPAVGCHVVFESDDGSLSWSVTGSEGRYRLLYTSERSGVIPGRKTVRITSCPIGDSVPANGCRENIPSVYNAASTLVVDVPSSGGTFDFQLQSQE